MSKVNLMNCDCMTFMRGLPDKAYELAIVDVPYGIGASEMTMGKGKHKKFTKGKGWDKEVPTKQYFAELFRISKNQIIWGGNYFTLPVSRGWIFWDKGLNGKTSFSDGELAWTSFKISLRKANIRYDGFIGADDCRIHPTQKPVALYKWLLMNYAKQGDKILDTHGGSCSLAIACHDMGFDLDACEIDADYYRDAVARYERHAAQAQLFNGDLGYTYINGAEGAQQAELQIVTGNMELQRDAFLGDKL